MEREGEETAGFYFLHGHPQPSKSKSIPKGERYFVLCSWALAPSKPKKKKMKLHQNAHETSTFQLRRGLRALPVNAPRGGRGNDRNSTRVVRLRSVTGTGGVLLQQLCLFELFQFRFLLRGKSALSTKLSKVQPTSITQSSSSVRSATPFWCFRDVARVAPAGRRSGRSFISFLVFLFRLVTGSGRR